MLKTELDPNTKCKLYVHFSATEIKVFHGVKIKNINTILGKRDGKFHTHITVGSKRKKEPIKYFKLEDIKLND
mgnify:CR=1 FL=1